MRKTLGMVGYTSDYTRHARVPDTPKPGLPRAYCGVWLSQWAATVAFGYLHVSCPRCLAHPEVLAVRVAHALGDQ